MTKNEHGIVFNARTGHNHDGINSAPVSIADGLIELRHLSAELLEYLETYSSGGTNSPDTTGISVVNPPELNWTTASLEPGESATGTLPWVNNAVVNRTYVETTAGATCEIVFYHDGEFTNDKREFKAKDVTNEFLWEGLWAHTDETGSGNIYYKITNTGTITSEFDVTLRSSTMVAASAGIGGTVDDVVPESLANWVKNAFAVSVLLLAFMGWDDTEILAIVAQYDIPWYGGAWISITYQQLILYYSFFIRVQGIAEVVVITSLHVPIKLDGTLCTTPDDIPTAPVTGDTTSFTFTQPARGTVILNESQLVLIQATGVDASHGRVNLNGDIIATAPVVDGHFAVSVPISLIWYLNESGGASYTFDITFPGATTGLAGVAFAWKAQPQHETLLGYLGGGL